MTMTATKAKPKVQRIHSLKPDKPRLAGRPPIYNEDLAKLICRRLANGESLRAICDDKEMPDRGTVLGWVDDYPEFATMYARARDRQQEAYAEDGVYIADTEPDPTRARNRILSRQWYAEKLKPKKFGPKIGIEGTAPDGGIIVHITGDDEKLM